MTKYYSTQRPIGPGTYPKPQNNKVIEIKNFDKKEKIEKEDINAYGYIKYEKPLMPAAAKTYELTLALALDETEKTIEENLQNNCVNSYVNRILDKQTNVLFGRKVSRPDIPYITIEIKDNRVLQARYKGNINCTAEDTKTIESYIASIKTPDKKNQAA